jgi:hypothetical protein
LFVALEQGPQFASVTAAGALAGGLAWLSFAISYAWAATRASWFPALLAGLSAYLGVGMALTLWAPPFALVVCMMGAAVVLTPFAFPGIVPSAGRAVASRAEIWVRMAAGGVLTVSVTQLSPVLGPRFSGLLAVFPVMGIVLAGFSHRAGGGLFAIHLLRGMVLGFHAFAAFCLVVAFSLHALGIAAAFTLALGIALAVHFAALRFIKRAG